MLFMAIRRWFCKHPTWSEYWTVHTIIKRCTTCGKTEVRLR